MFDYILLAKRNLFERRTRSLLTIVGIFLAVLTIFVLLSLSLGLQKTVNEQFEELGGTKFFIQPKGQLSAIGSNAATQLGLKDLEVVEKVPGVALASYYTGENAKVEFKKEIRYTIAAGIPEESEKSEAYFQSGLPELIEGRLLKEGDSMKVVLGNRYKEGNFFSEPIKTGDNILINDVPFEVVGILDAIGSPPDDGLVHMPREDMKIVFNNGERIDAMIIEVVSANDIEAIAERVEKKLMKHRDVDEKTIDFTVLTPEEILASFGTVLNILTAFLVGIGAISLLVGGIGIANTMYTSVLERKKEIGVMKAVGAKNSDILIIFIIEAGILGLFGGMLGVIFGMGIAKSIEYIASIALGGDLLKVSLSPIIIFGSLLFAFIIGIISGFIPSYQASSIKPVDALRYE
jgi:putative ABC transport system permease protein